MPKENHCQNEYLNADICIVKFNSINIKRYYVNTVKMSKVFIGRSRNFCF